MYYTLIEKIYIQTQQLLSPALWEVSLVWLRLDGWVVVHPHLLLLVLPHGDAVAGDSPQGLVHRGRVKEVKVWPLLLDGLGRLLRVVVRHAGVEVVEHVRASNVVLDPVHDRIVRSVDGQESTPDVVPLLSLQMRDVGVRVVQERDDSQPRVVDKVGSAVDGHDDPGGGALGPVAQEAEKGDHSQARGDDLLLPLLWEEGRL